LTEARVDPVQSSGRKLGITRGVLEPVLRWLAEIVAAVIQPFGYFSRPTYPASSDVTAEKGSEDVVEGTQAVVTATEDAVARPTTVKSFTASVTADPVREIDGSHRVAANQSPDFSHAAADITRASDDARALGASNVVGNVRISKVNAIENACLVARARQLITHSEFAEGYNLIKGMQGDEFLTALRMLAGREVMVKKLSDFKEKHKGEKSESVAGLLTRAAEEGDEEAISLLAAGALEGEFENESGSLGDSDTLNASSALPINASD
jgi:hypothetical protein